MDQPIDPGEQPGDERDRGRSAAVLPFPKRHAEITDHPVEPAPRLRDVIGDVLRDERLEQARTLADVAETAAVSLPYLSEVERGTKEVSSDLLAAICDALELPMADLAQRTADRLRAGGTQVTMLAA